MNTLVKDVMTANAIWVEQDTPFAAIAGALREYRVSAFPVLDEVGKVIGVVSESDLLAKLALGGGEDQMPGMITGILHQHQMEKARAVTAGDLMTSPAATVSPGDTVEQPPSSCTCARSSASRSWTRTVTWPGSSAEQTCWPSTTAPRRGNRRGDQERHRGTRVPGRR